jgi:hypothetical protein
LPFKDIFVIQILGMLITRKFSGIASFMIGNSQKHVAGIWFNDGMVTNIHYIDQKEIQALKAIAWYHEGSLELAPKKISKAPLPHYSKMLEEFLKDVPIQVVETCPLLMQAIISRVKLKPLKNSQLSFAGLTLFGKIAEESLLIDIPRNIFSNEKDFWIGFWYLTCHGLIKVNYAKSIGALFKNFQEQLTKLMKKLMGVHIANAYTNQLWQNIHRQWLDFDQNKAPDPIYGTSPYRLWALMMQKTLTQVGAAALQKHCFEKALSTCSTQTAEMIHLFINT